MIVSMAQTRRDGEVLFNEGRYQEAYDVYKYLIRRYPKDYLLKYQAGRCLFEMNRYDEALLMFEAAAENNIVKSNLYLSDIYFDQYFFEKSANAISICIEDLDEEQDSLLNIYNKKLLRANLGISMLDRVEDIAIIDSVKVHKSHFLSAYRLPRDLGKLDLYYEVYGRLTEQPQLAYYTGRGDKMLFSKECYDEQLDLNVSYRLVGGWSEPTNLSSVLNTSEDENFPFELPDGVTLYFASKGHNSLGGYDIFMSRYNTVINDYSEPVNIGMPFNSPANDYLYVFDELTHIGWFATDRFQHPDTVVVYEFVPNQEKLLIRVEDEEYKRLAAQLKVYRKAKLEAEEENVKTEEVEQQESEIKFLVNDGILYTRMTQFKSEEAKKLYIKSQEADKRLCTLLRLLEGKRREFFFSDIEEDQNILRAEILELEADVRKYKDMVENYILQTRKEEIKSLGVK